jgi:hypothetical protein
VAAIGREVADGLQLTAEEARRLGHLVELVGADRETIASDTAAGGRVVGVTSRAHLPFTRLHPGFGLDVLFVPVVLRLQRLEVRLRGLPRGRRSRPRLVGGRLLFGLGRGVDRVALGRHLLEDFGLRGLQLLFASRHREHSQK